MSMRSWRQRYFVFDSTDGGTLRIFTNAERTTSRGSLKVLSCFDVPDRPSKRINRIDFRGLLHTNNQVEASQVVICVSCHTPHQKAQWLKYVRSIGCNSDWVHPRFGSEGQR